MSFVEKLLPKGFTVLSKSGCPNCTKVKKRLQGHSLVYREINCDEDLLENKIAFLSCVEGIVGRPYTTFPMVFYDQKFVGGWTESETFIENMFLTFEECF